jgi:hypothetical protein
MNGIIEWAHNTTIEAERFLARWQYFDSVYLIASSLTLLYGHLIRFQGKSEL